MSYIYVVTVSALLASCVQGPGLFQQDENADAALTVDGSEIDGIVTGKFSAGSTVTQSLGASANSSIAGSKLSIPAGALDIDTDISIEEGASISGSALASQLGLSGGMNASGPSVVISSSAKVDGKNAFTLQIPTGGASLALASESDRMIVAFKYYVAASDAYFVGLYTRDQINIKDGYAEFSTKYFGSYQVAITDEVVKQPIKVESDTPILTKAEESKLEPVRWSVGTPVYKAASGSSYREARFPIAVRGFARLKRCGVYVHEDKNAAPVFYDYTEKSEDLNGLTNNAEGPHIEIENDAAHTLFAKFECSDVTGRYEISPWSRGVDVPAYVASTPSGSSNTIEVSNVGFTTPSSSVSLIVNWTNPASSVLGYLVMIGTSVPASCTTASSIFVSSDNTSATARVPGLIPVTAYYARVCTIDSNGDISAGIASSTAVTTLSEQLPSGSAFTCTGSNPAACSRDNCGVMAFSGDIYFHGRFDLTMDCNLSGVGSAKFTIDTTGNFTVAAELHANFEINAYNIAVNSTKYISALAKSSTTADYGGVIVLNAENQINLNGELIAAGASTGKNGGNIILHASSISIGANVTANGGSTSSGTGGSGGSVEIDSDNFVVSANGVLIEAKGAIGGSGSIGGQGGSIDLYVRNLLNIVGYGLNLHTYGGNGGSGSPAGSGGNAGNIVVYGENVTGSSGADFYIIATGGGVGTGSGTPSVGTGGGISWNTSAAPTNIVLHCNGASETCP